MDVEAAQISLNDLDVQLGRMSEEAGPRYTGHSLVYVD